MNARIPAVLGALALGVVALTGCSAAAGAAGADLAGARQPLSQTAAADTTTGAVSVTSLTADQFATQRGEGTCASYSGVTYCQKLQSHGVGSAAYVSWTAYLSVPQDTIDATMRIGGQGFEYTAPLEADAGYVKVVWSSPNIPSLMTLQTDVEITLDDGTSYSANNSYATYESRGDMYDEEELVLEPA
jgi:hypothetical protein